MSRSLQTLCVTLTLVLLTMARSDENCPQNCRCVSLMTGSQKAVCRGGSLPTILSSLGPNFTSLHVSSASNLRTLRPLDFSSASKVPLKHLSITNCWVQDIQDGTFQDLHELLELDLSFNNIGAIRQGAFSGLSSLRVLNLTRNNVASVASVLQSLHNLEKLDLSYNALEDLHTGAFRSQSHLSFLRLDGNHLENLHGYVFQGLQNLRHLSLRHCLLSKIASDMFSIVRSIQILDLGQNQIQELPSSEEFRNLPSLTQLLLDKNQITELKDSQFSGITLDILRLSYNKIKGITPETFKYFNTREIDLSYNLLEEMQDGFLRPTAPQLEHLNLAGNPLQFIPKFAFDGLYRLKVLNISNCQLDRLDKKQFDNLQNLQQLDVSMNRLKNIPNEVFQELDKSVTLHVHKNYWQCDCHIKPLKHWLEKSKKDVLTCYKDSLYQNLCATEKCYTPSTLTNTQITMLEESDINVCASEGESSNQLPTNTQAAIVVTCLVVAIFFIAIAILLWRRGKTQDELRKQCVRSPSEPVSSHLDFLEPKVYPFDTVSLTQSDHNYVFRKYFQTMPSNPDLCQEVTSLSQNPSMGGADSVYSSMPSVSSGSSVNIGMESTV